MLGARAGQLYDTSTPRSTILGARPLRIRDFCQVPFCATIGLKLYGCCIWLGRHVVGCRKDFVFLQPCYRADERLSGRMTRNLSSCLTISGGDKILRLKDTSVFRNFPQYVAWILTAATTRQSILISSNRHSQKLFLKAETPFVEVALHYQLGFLI